MRYTNTGTPPLSIPFMKCDQNRIECCCQRWQLQKSFSRQSILIAVAASAVETNHNNVTASILSAPGISLKSVLFLECSVGLFFFFSLGRVSVPELHSDTFASLSVGLINNFFSMSHSVECFWSCYLNRWFCKVWIYFSQYYRHEENLIIPNVNWRN